VYGEAEKLNPNNLRPYNGIAIVHLFKGENETAKEEIDRLLGFGPSFPEIFITAGCYSWSAKKDQAEALKYLELAIKSGYLKPSRENYSRLFDDDDYGRLLGGLNSEEGFMEIVNAEKK
jgi:tetratricopeptide (TPR) repeat protein